MLDHPAARGSTGSPSCRQDLRPVRGAFAARVTLTMPAAGQVSEGTTPPPGVLVSPAEVVVRDDQDGIVEDLGGGGAR